MWEAGHPRTPTNRSRRRDSDMRMDAKPDGMDTADGPAPNTHRVVSVASSSVTAETKAPGGSVEPSESGILPDAETAKAIPSGLHRLHAQSEVEVVTRHQSDDKCGELPRRPLSQHIPSHTGWAQEVIDRIQVDTAWTGKSATPFARCEGALDASGEQQYGMGCKEKVKVKMYGNGAAWNVVLM